jgi:hypothetical protein
LLICWYQAFVSTDGFFFDPGKLCQDTLCRTLSRAAKREENGREDSQQPGLETMHILDDVLSHPCSASLVQELMLAKQAEEESSRATKEDAFSRCVWNLSIFTR